MQNRTNIDNLINSNLPDNASRFISAELLREVVESLNDSSLNLIDDKNLLGLNTWKDNRVYNLGNGVIHNNVLYKAKVANTTYGSFIAGEWLQISNAYNGTNSYEDFILKTNGIELDNNKKIKIIPTDTTLSGHVTGLYSAQAITAITGLDKVYPVSGKAVVQILNGVSTSDSLISYFPLADLGKYYIKKVSSSVWTEFNNLKSLQTKGVNANTRLITKDDLTGELYQIKLSSLPNGTGGTIGIDYIFRNGLNEVANNVGLGGTLINDTYIDVNNNIFQLTVPSYQTLAVSGAGVYSSGGYWMRENRSLNWTYSGLQHTSGSYSAIAKINADGGGMQFIHGSNSRVNIQNGSASKLTLGAGGVYLNYNPKNGLILADGNTRLDSAYGITFSDNNNIGAKYASDYSSSWTTSVYYDNILVNKKYVDKAILNLSTSGSALSYTPENEVNKVFDFTTIDNITYPTTSAVSDFVYNNAEQMYNKASDFSVIDNGKYPTTQAVSDFVNYQISSSITSYYDFYNDGYGFHLAYDNNGAGTGVVSTINGASGVLDVYSTYGINFSTYAAYPIVLDGTITSNSLAGTGTRMVVANSTGVLSTQTISSGVTTFTGLSDVPSSYTSQASKLVRVNSGATALEFFTPTYITLTSLSGTTPITYNNSTGAIGINTASSFVTGALTSTDWNTFNNKQTSLSGTGFVKISGTTISYDNSTYLTANQNITISGDVSGSGTTSISTTVNTINGITKNYYDVTSSIQTQFNNIPAKSAARAVNIVTLPTFTYNNGASGVGATMTATANGALPAQDGITLVNGELLLVTTETTSRGLYIVTQIGDASNPWILTRDISMNLPSHFIAPFVYIRSGTVNSRSIWGGNANVNSNFIIGTNQTSFLKITSVATYVDQAYNGLVLTTAGSPSVKQIGLGGTLTQNTTIDGNFILAIGTTTRLNNISLYGSNLYLDSTNDVTINGNGFLTSSFSDVSLSGFSSFEITGTSYISLNTTSLIFSGLSGSGTRMLVVNSTGAVSAQTIPSGGASAFTSLSDVPSSYTSQALKLVRVNSGATALEFFTPTYLTSAITSLNTLTGSTQTFATGVSGSNFNIVSSSTTHTFNIPNASTTNRGLLTNTDWNTFNNKFSLPALTTGSILFSNGTTISQNNSSLFWDNTNNRIGFLTAAPTHTITLGSTSTGLSIYNTVDQTTNLERLRIYVATNIFNIQSDNGGTGTNRVLQISAQGTTLKLTNGSGQVSSFNVDRSLGASNAVHTAFTGGITSSTGITGYVATFPTVNQTSTGGYKMFWASPYEQGVGSGSKLLMDLGTNSAANGSGTHTSKFTVTNTGVVQIAGLTGTGTGIVTASSSGLLARTNDIIINSISTTSAIKTLTLDQNDYAIGTGTFFRLTSTPARTITGIAAATDGKQLIIANVGSGTITLKNYDSGSLAANRFLFTSGADLPLVTNAVAMFIYDSGSGVWRNISLGY